MEERFVNQHIYTKEFYREFLSYFYFKRSYAVFYYSILAICFIFGILLVTIFDSDILAIYLLITPVIIFFIQILKYIRTKKLRYNQDLEINSGKPIEVKFSVTESEIEVLISDSKKIIPLSKIKKVIKTKNYYLLLSHSKIGFAFKKDSFIKGAQEEFLSFLASKGFKIKSEFGIGKTVLVGVALSISLVFLTMCGNHTITSKDIYDIAKEENLTVVKGKTTDKHLVSRLSIDGTKKGLPKVIFSTFDSVENANSNYNTVKTILAWGVFKDRKNAIIKEKKWSNGTKAIYYGNQKTNNYDYAFVKGKTVLAVNIHGDKANADKIVNELGYDTNWTIK